MNRIIGAGIRVNRSLSVIRDFLQLGYVGVVNRSQEKEKMKKCQHPSCLVGHEIHYIFQNIFVKCFELIATLNGHYKRLTALAFSTALDVLVSLGEDAKLCLWSTSEWKNKRLIILQYVAQFLKSKQQRAKYAMLKEEC